MPLLPILSNPSAPLPATPIATQPPEATAPHAPFLTPLPPLIPLANFTPSEELIDQLLAYRLDPVHTLADMACQARLSLQDLLLWLESPEIAQRILRLRTQMLTANQDLAISTLHMSLSLLGTITRACADSMSRFTAAHNDRRGHDLIRRICETGLRATALLQRLSLNQACPERTTKLTEKIGRHFARHLAKRIPTP